MKRTLVVALVIGLVAGSLALPAEAGKKKKKKKKKVERVERTTSGTYDGPAIGAAGNGICSPGTLGCFAFGSGPDEAFVSVTITDTLPTGVLASVTQDLDGDNFADYGVDICGASEEPIPITPGYEVTVFIWEGPSASPVCAGGATSGTIELTFSNLP